MPEPRKYTEAQKKSAKKWDAANLDRISVAAPRGTKERWKAAAAARNMSLNQLIVEAVDNQVAQGAAVGPVEAGEAGGMAEDGAQPLDGSSAVSGPSEGN